MYLRRSKAVAESRPVFDRRNFAQHYKRVTLLLIGGFFLGVQFGCDKRFACAALTKDPVNVLRFCKNLSCLGIHDESVIQAAIDAVDSGELQGRMIRIPAGIYNIRNQLVIRNKTGIVISGDGTGATLLKAFGPHIERKSIVLLVNSSEVVIENLSIEGDRKHVPSAAIESHVDNPTYDFSLWPTGNIFRNLVLGSRKLSTDGKRDAAAIGNGIRFTANSGSDGNNDQSVIENVRIYGFSQAAVSIEHSNSLLHRIVNGVFGYGPIGVYVAGGSFQMSGTNLFVDEWDFDFDKPKVVNLRAPNGDLRDTSGYHHASTVSSVASEGESNMLRTAAWPEEGFTKQSGRTGIHISFLGYDRSGVKFIPNSAALGAALEIKSAGHVAISGSHLNFGRPTTISSTHPAADLTITGTTVSHVYQFMVRGSLASVANVYTGGSAEVHGHPVAVTTTADRRESHK
jgi:hypothetical protein